MPERRRPEDPFIVRMQAKRLADSVNALSQRDSAKNATFLQRIVALWGVIFAVLTKVAVLPVLAAAIWLFWGSATKTTLVVLPVSAPESLVKNGHTGDLIADLLRSELDRMIVYARSMKQGASIFSKEDIPDITLPNAGMSAEAIASHLRRLFGVKQYWQIDCAIVTASDGKLTAHTKISNGSVTKPRLVSIEAQNIQKLVEATARQVLGVTDPVILSYYAYRNHEYAYSIDIARKILDSSSKDDNALLLAHNMLGNNKMALEKGSIEAEREYRFVISEAARKASDPVNLLRAIAGGSDDALALFEAVNNNLGILLYDRGDVLSAEKLYRTAIEINHRDVAVHNNLGNLLYDEKRDFATAEKEYLVAKILSPNDADAHNNFGQLLREQKDDIEGAEKEYRLAIEADPKNSDAHINLGYLLENYKKNITEAEKEYRFAIESDPKNSYAHNNLGHLLENYKKNITEAEKEYGLVIESDPKNSYAHSSLGHLLEEYKNDVDEAEREYRLAVADNPKNSVAHYYLGKLLMKADHKVIKDMDDRDVDDLETEFFETMNEDNLPQSLRIYEIIRHFRKAAELTPDSSAYDWNLQQAQKKLCEAEIPEHQSLPSLIGKNKKHLLRPR